MINPAGFLKALDNLFASMTSTSLPAPDDPEDPAPYDPELDAPWTITIWKDTMTGGRDNGSVWLYRILAIAREIGGTTDTYYLWLLYNRGFVAGYRDPFEDRRPPVG